MKVVERVFGFTRTGRVVNDASLRESRCVHAALHRFHQCDVFDLQDGVDIADGIKFGFGGLGRFKKKIISLKSPVQAGRNDVEHDDGRASGIAHDACVRPEPPDSVGSNGCLRNIIGRVRRVARFRHVTGIDFMRRDFVAVHVDEFAKILVRGRAVVAFKKIIHDVFPIGLDVVGKTMPKGQTLDIGCPVADFFFQVAALLPEGFCVRIKIDIDETAEAFDPNGIQTNVLNIEVDEVFAVGCTGETSVKAVKPCVVGTEDFRNFPFAPEEFVGPVFADIVKSAQIVFLVAQDCYGVSGDSRCHVRTGFSQFLLMADPLPASRENRCLVKVKITPLRIGVGVEGG